jgi:hypothetical protein
LRFEGKYVAAYAEKNSPEFKEIEARIKTAVCGFNKMVFPVVSY